MIYAVFFLAMTCYKTNESVDGFYKICYYDCAGSQVAETIKATELCPYTIKK